MESEPINTVPPGLFAGSILSWLWGILSLLIASGLHYLTKGTFLEYSTFLFIVGLGLCISGYGLKKTKAWANWAGVAACFAGILLFFQFPFDLSREVLIGLLAGPAVILALLISHWKNEVNRSFFRPIVTCIALAGFLALTWFFWDRPARAVAAETGRFSKLPAGIVVDQETGLQWHVGPDSVGWTEAKEWAAALNIEGSGFRLPTRRELNRIYQKGAGPLNINPAFDLKMDWVWSAESKRSRMAGYFNFRLGKGTWNWIGPEHQGQALAVRET